MKFISHFIRPGLMVAAVVLMFAEPLFALPNTSPASRRPHMPRKPPIFGIPNGGRDARFQPGHGAYGNVQGTTGAAAGQAGQAGQGALGGVGAGAFGAQGGAAAFGQFGNSGGGLFGGGLFGGFGGGFKGLSIGGNLLGPEVHYRNGIGLYGGTAALDGAIKESESPRAEAPPGKGYQHLLLHPVVTEALKGN